MGMNYKSVNVRGSWVGGLDSGKMSMLLEEGLS